MLKVVKLGGDANATAEDVLRSARFIVDDYDRRVVVTSAPGKRPQDEMKLTQMLYKAAGLDKKERKQFVEHKVEERFHDITDPLGIDFNILAPSFEHLYKLLDVFDVKNQSHVDELKFFGERCQQYVLAETIKQVGGGAVVMSPYELGVILEEDHGVIVFSPASYRFIRDNYNKLAEDQILVTAGFGGYDKYSNLRTLPFGGTDVSAAHIARALGADMYENVKCVDGYANVDPRLIAGTDLESALVHYDFVSFEEAMEASGAGAQVIHAHALTPCRGGGVNKEIPIRVCNMMKPDETGTIITDQKSSKYDNPNKFVTKKDGFYLITIEDDTMVSAQSYAADVQAQLGARHIPYDHIASSENSFTLAVSEDNFAGDESRLKGYKDEVEKLFPGAKVSYEPGISMLAVINSARVRVPGLLAKASVALAMNDINIDFASQAKDKAMIFGVDTKRIDEAVVAVVKEYYSGEQYLPDLPKRK